MKKFKLSYIILLSNIILILFSCKSKYEELKIKYDKALDKKKQMLSENPKLKNRIIVLSDSLYIPTSEYNTLTVFNNDLKKIVKFKEAFIKNKLEYYKKLTAK